MSTKAGRGNHAPLAYTPEPVRIQRRFGKGEEQFVTVDYFGEDALDQWLEAHREIAWADTEKGAP